MTKRLLASTLVLGLVPGCSRWTNDAPSQAGATAVDWTMASTVSSSKASFGTPTEPPVISLHQLVYVPGKAKLGEASGGPRVEVTVRVEHGPVPLVAPAGYATSVIAPRHVSVTVAEGAGWTVAGSCHQPSMLPIGASQGDASTVVQIGCALQIDYGWNKRLLPFDVMGDGRVVTHPIGDDVVEEGTSPKTG